MSARHETSTPDQGRALLETAGKTVLLVRLVALLLTATATAGTAPAAAAAGLLVLVAVNAALLLRWSRLVPVVRRHPGLLALDVVVSLAALALPGSNAQLLYEAAGALLIGMVMPRAGAFLLVALLAAGQLLVGLGPDGGQAPVTLAADAALVALLAGVGAVVRRGHDALVASLATAARREADLAHASAATAERARLAREMHDGVAKSLFGMTLTATALARTAAEPAARALAGDLAGCATACGEQVRELLGELRAGSAGDAADDLGAVVGAWSVRTGVPARTDLVAADGSRGAAGAAARAVAAAVLREALDNVARHSGAGAVDVRATDDGETLTMTVHDDGAGFDPGAAAPGRWGVVGMRERAVEAGGTLTVTSAARAGTTVTLRVPSAPTGPGPAPGPPGAGVPLEAAA